MVMDPLLFGTSVNAIDVGFIEAEFDPARDSDDASLVSSWREACRSLLGYVARRHPELRVPPGVAGELERSLPGALTSPWVALYGRPRGLALRMVAVLRQDLAPQVPPLVPPKRAMDSAEELWRSRDDWGVRLAELDKALARPDASSPHRVKAAFGLTDAELGRMFGVSRQAVAQWRGEFPAHLRAKAATVLATADILDYRLKPGRLPLVARKPASAYDDHTMLELIADDRHDELLTLTRASFDWSSTA